MAGGDEERQQCHCTGNDGGEAKDRRQAYAGVLQRNGAEGGDPIAELVEGDNAACHAAMASATCGRNMSPYGELDSPYWLLLVKMVLAAGNVTRTMPCTSPAALTTVRSVFEAIRYPGSSSLQVNPGSYRLQTQSARRPGAAIPPSQGEGCRPDGQHLRGTAMAEIIKVYLTCWLAPGSPAPASPDLLPAMVRAGDISQGHPPRRRRLGSATKSTLDGRCAVSLSQRMVVHVTEHHDVVIGDSGIWGRTLARNRAVRPAQEWTGR